MKIFGEGKVLAIQLPNIRLWDSSHDVVRSTKYNICNKETQIIHADTAYHKEGIFIKVNKLSYAHRIWSNTTSLQPAGFFSTFTTCTLPASLLLWRFLKACNASSIRL